MNPVFAEWQMPRPSLNTPGRIRALNVREWRDCMASTITLVGGWHVENVALR